MEERERAVEVVEQLPWMMTVMMMVMMRGRTS
jgi:hypothetical protein